MTETNLNTVTWWELPVADLDAAAAFYGSVFGWISTPMSDTVRAIVNDGAMIGAIWLAPPESVRTTGTRLYVNVGDVEATLAAVVEAGGTVEQGRTEIGGDMGWWAEIRDPGGTWLGLCTSHGPA